MGFASVGLPSVQDSDLHSSVEKPHPGNGSPCGLMGLALIGLALIGLALIGVGPPLY
jgi:hypothetical protein